MKLTHWDRLSSLPKLKPPSLGWPSSLTPYPLTHQLLTFSSSLSDRIHGGNQRVIGAVEYRRVHGAFLQRGVAVAWQLYHWADTDCRGGGISLKGGALVLRERGQIWPTTSTGYRWGYSGCEVHLDCCSACSSGLVVYARISMNLQLFQRTTNSPFAIEPTGITIQLITQSFGR
jgi:hypothetical protein